VRNPTEAQKGFRAALKLLNRERVQEDAHARVIPVEARRGFSKNSPIILASLQTRDRKLCAKVGDKGFNGDLGGKIFLLNARGGKPARKSVSNPPHPAPKELHAFPSPFYIPVNFHCLE